MMTISLNSCMAQIANLPQAEFIELEVAHRWLRRTAYIDSERLEWHIRRAGGVGGSEAGSMLAWKYGEFAARNSAERLGKSKLLILPPDRPNDDTARGAYLEPFIQSVYERKLSERTQNWRRRDDIQQVIEHAPHPVYPWLRASVDQVYEIDGGICIVDFKAPSTAMLEEYVKHQHFHEYAAQLNHYALVAAGHGIRIDSLELAMFDYRRVATKGCEVFPIALDYSLQHKLIEASGSFWNDYILKGLIPEGKNEPILGANAGIPDEIEELAREAVVHKTIAKKADEAYSERQDKIAAWVKATGSLGNGMLPLGRLNGDPEQQGLLQVRGKQVFDMDSAIQRLKDLGMPEEEIEDLRGDPGYDLKRLPKVYENAKNAIEILLLTVRDNKELPENFDKILKKGLMKPRIRSYDEKKVSEALESFGEVPYSFLTEGVSSGLPKGFSQEKEELTERVSVDVDFLVSDCLVSCMCEKEKEPGVQSQHSLS